VKFKKIVLPFLALMGVKSLLKWNCLFFLRKKSDQRKLLFYLGKKQLREKAGNGQREIAPEKGFYKLCIYNHQFLIKITWIKQLHLKK
jgi:hypothetical protein